MQLVVNFEFNKFITWKIRFFALYFLIISYLYSIGSSKYLNINPIKIIITPYYPLISKNGHSKIPKRSNLTSTIIVISTLLTLTFIFPIIIFIIIFIIRHPYNTNPPLTAFHTKKSRPNNKNNVHSSTIIIIIDLLPKVYIHYCHI